MRVLLIFSDGSVKTVEESCDSKINTSTAVYGRAILDLSE